MVSHPVVHVPDAETTAFILMISWSYLHVLKAKVRQEISAGKTEFN